MGRVADSFAGSMFLALDTSGPVGSVAVSFGPDVLARGVLTRRAEHASGLLPTVDEVLRDAGVERTELRGGIVGGGGRTTTTARAPARHTGSLLGSTIWRVRGQRVT